MNDSQDTIRAVIKYFYGKRPRTPSRNIFSLVSQKNQKNKTKQGKFN